MAVDALEQQVLGSKLFEYLSVFILALEEHGPFELPQHFQFELRGFELAVEQKGAEGMAGRLQQIGIASQPVFFVPVKHAAQY